MPLHPGRVPDTVEFFEIGAGDAHPDAFGDSDPRAQPRHVDRRRRGLTTAAVVAAVGLLAAAALTHRDADAAARAAAARPAVGPAVTTPPPAPTSAPPNQAAPTIVAVGLDLVDPLCPVTCVVVALPQPELWQYLKAFGTAVVTVGSAVIRDTGGAPLGQVTEEDFTNGVSIRLTVMPARGATPAPFLQTRTPEASMATLATRRSGWDLFASISFGSASGNVPVPFGAAREWLRAAPLPS